MSTRRKRRDYPIGTVITGTLRIQDLIPAFLTELDWNGPLTREERACMRGIERELAGSRPNTRNRCNHANQEFPHCALCCPCVECEQTRIDNYFASDDAIHDYQWLEDALNTKAGPFMYFGAHPGDGSNFGFWLHPNWEEDLEDSGTKVTDLVTFLEGQPTFTGHIAVVSDHGNVTLYNRWWTGRFYKCVQEWALV